MRREAGGLGGGTGQHEEGGEAAKARGGAGAGSNMGRGGIGRGAKSIMRGQPAQVWGHGAGGGGGRKSNACLLCSYSSV